MGYMVNNSSNITLSKALIKRKGGIAILPLEEYERIKEDLDMFLSKRLAKEVERARKEIKKGKIISFEDAEKKLNL